MPLGPAQQYLARYNTYQLPGYVQSESFDSQMNIAAHYGAYIDGSSSEETGLANKQLTLTLKVWEQNYLTCKQQIETAATMLRSSRSGFAPLYVQSSDRHYDALVKSIKTDKQVPSSVRILEYSVDFECKPWAIENSTQTLTGTNIIDTDQVGRTIDDGGYTPTIVDVTGSNITIQGNINSGASTGLITISGAVTNMIVDTEKFTATMGGINRNDLMTTVDYRLYVGPEKTTFTIDGATDCTISYSNRWYI